MMEIFYKITGPLIRKLPANWAHDLAILGLKYNPFIGAAKIAQDKALQMEWKDKVFAHPIGLAPGFDKNAEVINALSQLGFAHMEVGAVTVKAQSGNPRPTIFREPAHKAIINRMGFNNKGLAAVECNLQSYKGGIPLGVNIGKNKITANARGDYSLLTQKLAAYVDWITINVSSPNTPGLRDLQNIESLAEIIQIVKEQVKNTQNRPFILVKIAPDLNENDLVDLAQMFKKQSVDGVVTTNTTLARPAGLSEKFAAQAGGLSGRPLFDLSLHVQKIIASELKNTPIKIIASGGIEDGETAWQRIIYGASFVQIYTAMIWKGPYLSAHIARQLSKKLQQEGIKHISDAVGISL